MSGRLTDTVSAEVLKLRTLPAVRAAVLGTVAAAAGLTALLATAQNAPTDAESAVVQAMPYLQVGAALLGILGTASEYAGGQVRTTLTAAPRRGRLLTAKTAACLLASAVMGAGAVAAGLVGASLALSGAEVLSGASAWPLAGMAAYLALLALLAHLLTVVARSPLPPLVSLLGLLLIVSPLLAGMTEHARWLPDRAGRLLYLTDADPVLAPWTGGLVLCAWLVAAGGSAALVFHRRDA